MEVFISYRRSDSGYVSDLLHGKMLQSISEDRIFIDRESIPPGTNFDQFLRQSVENAKVVVPVIGARWQSEMDARIKPGNPDDIDYVRMELALALSLSKPIIPVLVESAAMPSANQLPEDLAELAFKNAITLRRQPDFDNDVDVLLKEIENIIGSKPIKTKEELPFFNL